MEEHAEERRMSRVRQPRESATDVGTRRAWYWPERFVYLFPGEWCRLSGDPLIRGQELRLLIGLLQSVQWNNVCVGSLASAGRLVGLRKAAAYRSAAQLVTAGVLCCEPDPHNPQRYILHLSPALVWRGRPWLRSVGVRHYRALWAQYHGHLLPPPRAHEEASHPPDGTSTAGTSPFSHYPPRYPVSSV